MKGKIASPFSLETLLCLCQGLVDQAGRESISKDIDAVNSTINQLDLIDMYRILHLTRARVNTLLTFTWDIHQNRTCSRP